MSCMIWYELNNYNKNSLQSVSSSIHVILGNPLIRERISNKHIYFRPCQLTMDVRKLFVINSTPTERTNRF